jgi:alpha-glucosidase
MQRRKDWWRGGVIYQVYPRSFYDSRGDGIGDLGGVLEKLDYIASLNVDAIWLSPFFPSPMKDFGYDVSDYRGVDPIFGTLDDLKALLAGAHCRGLQVIIDQVLSHCSDQHPWFQQSCSARDGEYADWFVLADAKPDGTPPNNWQSVFGGPAWHWNAQRGQYYLHNFPNSQPDLNFHCSAVREQLLSDVEYWLEMGVDGFRLDAANFFFHDQALRDNPPNLQRQQSGIERSSTSPYGYQRHIYDKNRPETITFLKTLRTLLNQYPGTTALAEVGCDNGLRTMAAYTAAAIPCTWRIRSIS